MIHPSLIVSQSPSLVEYMSDENFDTKHEDCSDELSSGSEIYESPREEEDEEKGEQLKKKQTLDSSGDRRSWSCLTRSGFYFYVFLY